MTTITDYPFTSCAWFNTNNAVLEQNVVSIIDISTSNIFYLINIISGKFKIQARNGSNSSEISGGSVIANTWNHMCGVFISDTERELYGNSILIDTDTDSVGFINSVDSYLIGLTRTSSPVQRFNGSIDEVKIYSRALSSAEIQRRYLQGIGFRPMRTNDTTPTDRSTTDEASTCASYSSNRLNVSNGSDVLLMTFDENASDLSQFGNDGTIAGNPVHTTTGGYIGGAFEFDGVGDYINIPSIVGLDPAGGDISYTVWVKPKTIKSLDYILWRVDDELGIRGTSGNRYDYLCEGGGGTPCGQITGNTLTLNEWHFLAVTYDNTTGTMIAYEDGMKVGDNGGGGVLEPSGQLFRIGSDGTSSRTTNGTIDEVRVTNRVLSGLEINDTMNFGLSPNMNYSLMVKQIPERECSTTGTTEQICTTVLNDTLEIGLSSNFIACKDSSGNENSTSTSGMFYINITDPVPPKVELDVPSNDAFFLVGTNNTNIRFNGTCNDNVDTRYNITGYIDGVEELVNNSYENGTEFNFSKTINDLGNHNWNITCTDSYGNINSSQRDFTVEQEETVDLFLDGLSDTRKYEYRTKANISANCTESVALSCQVCIDLDAPDYGTNFSCGLNFTSFIFNITTLRRTNFTDGRGIHTLESSGLINITSDNRTIMQRVALNITSSGGDITNLNISYYGQELNFRGDLKTVYLIENEFLHFGVFKDAVNLTYTSTGSNFIYLDLTDIGNPNNLTFRLIGFELDLGNDIHYTEYFNGTDGSSSFDSSLTYQADAPLGVLDDFVNNNSRWTVSGVLEVDVTYGDSYLEIDLREELHTNINAITISNDLAADMRNTSIIAVEFDYYIFCSGSDSFATEVGSMDFEITDKTSTVILKTYSVFCTSGTKNERNYYNFTILNKRVSDDKLWELFINGSSEGNNDLSILDFDKRITFQIRQTISADDGGTGDSDLKIHNVKWGGAFLNYSKNNGTYKPIGNITQCLSDSTNNLQRATLNAIEYLPNNTGISYSLSNDATTFEGVTKGLIHTFITTGKKRCWRATLNSSINITSPVVKRIQYDVVSASMGNVTVDLGDDGIIDYIFIGNLSESIQLVNLTPRANQLNVIKISGGTPGQIQVDNFESNSSVNPVVLNITKFEDCSICSINFTFSGNSLTVFDLEFDFLGSWNYTATARALNLKINHTIQVFYSLFNLSLPFGIDFYDVFPSSKDAKNVTPFGQTSLTPIWNLTNQAYDEKIDIYVKMNETIDVCINSTWSNSSLRVKEINNESFVWINGTPVQLARSNLINGSGVVFNQTDGTEIGSNNYTIDYADGTITLNSSIVVNTTKINDTVSIELLVGNTNSSLLEFFPRFSETVNAFYFSFTIDNESFTWTQNNSAMQLAHGNITINSEILYNNDTKINKGANYTMNYTNGSITFTNASTYWNGTITELITDKFNITYTFVEPEVLLNKDIDYQIDYTLKNFTLINETFNNTLLFITYNYSTSTSFGDRQQFGINYSYFVEGYDLTVDNTFILNTSFQKIHNNIFVNTIAYPNKGVWNWWTLDNCTAGMILPWFYFAAQCSSCFFEESQLDNFNIIEG